MTGVWDPLSERERLGRPFLGSAVMHVALASLAWTWSWLAARNVILFGDPHAIQGGVVPISVVEQIPLTPAQAVYTNPVANDTRSTAPLPPQTGKPAQKAEPAEDAVPLPGPTKLKAERKAPERKFRPYVPDRDNQLYSTTGLGVNTPSYTGVQPTPSFGEGVGIGPGSALGSRYGWYVEALQRRIGGQWQRELTQVDVRIRSSPRTVVFFEILQDGTLRNVRVTQSSGNQTVDFAAARAVTNASPVPPLPTDLGRSSVSTEVWFQLKR